MSRITTVISSVPEPLFRSRKSPTEVLVEYWWKLHVREGPPFLSHQH